jgi:hypothetical protein
VAASGSLPAQWGTEGNDGERPRLDTAASFHRFGRNAQLLPRRTARTRNHTDWASTKRMTITPMIYKNGAVFEIHRKSHPSPHKITGNDIKRHAHYIPRPGAKQPKGGKIQENKKRRDQIPALLLSVFAD